MKYMMYMYVLESYHVLPISSWRFQLCSNVFGSRGGGSAAPMARKDTSLLEDPRLCYSVLLGRWCLMFPACPSRVTICWSDIE